MSYDGMISRYSPVLDGENDVCATLPAIGEYLGIENPS